MLIKENGINNRMFVKLLGEKIEQKTSGERFFRCKGKIEQKILGARDFSKVKVNALNQLR